MLYINSNEQFDECKNEMSNNTVNTEIIQNNTEIIQNNIEINLTFNGDLYLVVVNTNNKINKLLNIIKYSVLLLSIVIIFSDIDLLYKKNKCIYQQTSINFTIQQYLIVSIYSYITLFIYMYIYVSCIMKSLHESTHKKIRFIYLIYKLYLLILLIIGFVIFYHMIDTNLCNKYTYNYITSTQIIKFILLFVMNILI